MKCFLDSHFDAIYLHMYMNLNFCHSAGNLKKIYKQAVPLKTIQSNSNKNIEFVKIISGDTFLQ